MEIELKLLVEPDDHEKLRRHPLIANSAQEKPRQSQLNAIYFDTPDLSLRRHDAGLRVRSVSGQWIQTMKAGGDVQGGLHRRHEWECPVAGDRPDLDKLRELVGPDSEWSDLLGTPALAEALRPLFTVQVKRTTWNLSIGDEQIELVLDDGWIERDGTRVPVSEIELELKSGDPARLYEAALQLLERIPMRLGNKSKAERGYELSGHSSLAAVKAQRLELPGNATVEQGLLAVLGNCLAQIQANEAGVIESNDPESLHQMRVGLRRFRSALRLFEEIARCPEDLGQEIAWLGSELGPARDWDVLANGTLAGLADVPLIGKELSPARKPAADTARQARLQAARAVSSPRYARMLLSLFAWMQGAPRRRQAAPAQAAGWDRPLKAFAGDALVRAHRRIRRRGKRIGHAAPEELHRLRIACKRGRYAMEFFRSLYRPKRVRRYLAALEALQEELGRRNDAAVADGLLRRLQQEYSEGAAAAGFARGYLAAQSATDRRALSKAWKTFRATKAPFGSKKP